MKNQPTPESKEDWDWIGRFDDKFKGWKWDESMEKSVLNFISSEKKKSYDEGRRKEKNDQSWKRSKIAQKIIKYYVSQAKEEMRNTPMGVSQWKNHGKDYKYWDYFKQEVQEEMRKECIANIEEFGKDIDSATNPIWFKKQIIKLISGI